MPCKMDGRSAGVEPALATGRAEMWDRAVVRRLLGQGRRVESVEVEIDGCLRVVRAPVVVLAAGALSSPRLLLASASGDWGRAAPMAAGWSAGADVPPQRILCLVAAPRPVAPRSAQGIFDARSL